MHSKDYSNIEIEKKAVIAIFSFYMNAFKKWKNTNSLNWVYRQVDNIINQVENKKGVFVNDPLLNKWRGYNRMQMDMWNFATIVIDKTLHIVDACHSQNMSNHIPLDDDEEEEQQSNVNTRITDITLRERRDNRFLIKCKIDGEEQLFEVVTDDDSNLYRAKQITPEQLAEKYFKNALDQSIDLDHIVHFKR